MKNMKNMIDRWSKNRISYIHLGYNDFYNFDSFAIKLLEVLKENQQYSLLVKINYNKDLYAMVGKQIGFIHENGEDLGVFEVLHETLKQRIDMTLDNYDVEEISSIQILYVLIEDMSELKLKNVNKIGFNREFTNVKDTKERFNLIPLTTNTNYYGKLIIEDISLYLDRINKQRNILNESDLVLDVKDKMYYYKDNIIILSIEGSEYMYRGVYNGLSGILLDEIKDYIVDSESFIRKIGNVSLSISKDSIVKLESEKVLSPIRFIPKSLKDESNPFIGSWDVEAFDDIDGFAKVYALGFAVLGKESKMYYLDDGITSEKLVLNCINDMLVNEYNGYTFYTHNFGGYDSVFLIKILKEENLRLGDEHYKIKELCRDNKILKLTIKVKRSISNRKLRKTGDRNDPGFNTITIVDSLNILNQSLDKLCLSFNVPVTKGHFPYSFVKRNTLHYVGDTPSYEYWNKLSLEDFNQYVKPDWSLKDECLKYLNKDLVSLVMIMNKFSEYINRKYHLQVTESLTISRLALNIFFKDYLKDSKLPVINRNMFYDIKQAYYGGVTEVYRPHGTNLLHYDVNSLYPFAALNAMPGTKCTFIENIDKSLNLKDLFGFFYCEVKTGDNYLGLLPVHHEGIMIMPNGTWKGWYFSEELKYASDNGYTINVISGYNFNKVNDVFTEYVKDLYQIKSSTKDMVEKDIAKRLLNHLLGRFGLNIVKPVTKSVSSEELSLIFSTKEVIGKPIKITDNDYWITYNNQIDKDICEKHGIDYVKVQSLTPKTDIEKLNEFRDVSLSTAAAVTAYARIYMSKIKLDILDRGGNIYYTDTDSIVTDIPLDDNLVGNELGMFKLEYKIKEGYYISNKTYYIDLAEKMFDNYTKKLVSYVIKSKSVLSNSLTPDNFNELYEGNNVNAIKRSAIRDYYKGSVTIVDNKVNLKHDSYTKREKVSKGNKWVDTKPLVLVGDSIVEKKKYRSSKIIRESSLLSDWNDILLNYLYGFTVLILTLTLQIPDLDFELDCVNNQITLDLDFNLDEIIDLKYNDDYMEEPIEVDVYIANNSKSWTNDLLNLFTDKNCKPYNSHKVSLSLEPYLDLNSLTVNSLQNKAHGDRPEVLSTILKYQLDLLYDELTTLKVYYAKSELQKVQGDYMVHDALKMCKRALQGSPFSGINSPVLGISTSHFGGSPLIGDSPLIGSNSPILNRGSTLTGLGIPLNG